MDDIKEIVDSTNPVEPKYDKNNNVETADIAIATILFPIRMIVRARSYLSMILRRTLEILLPSSTSTCILNLLQQANDVSAPEKKKCNNINRIIIIHDIAGSGIKKPLPFRTKEFSEDTIIYLPTCKK